MKINSFTFEDKLISYQVVNKPDWVIDNGFTKGSFYELNMLKYIQQLNLKGNAIDIGANVGNHSVFFSMFCKFNKIYAYEPLQRNYNLLQANAELNEINNIILSPLALSNVEKEVTIYCPDESNPGHSLIKNELIKSSNEWAHIVQTQRLDDVMKEKKNISLIKIDVEGEEYEVLQGALEIIKQNQPHIFIETDKLEVITAYLSFLGYKLKEIFKRNGNTRDVHFCI